MDFTLSEEDLMIQETARRFAEDRLAPGVAQREKEERFDRDLWNEMAELGLCGMLIPEEYGGMGLGTFTQCVALEEICRIDPAMGVTLSVHASLTCNAIAMFGSDALKEKYLPKLASGEWIGAYSLTEPGAGSDAAGLICKAENQGDHYRVNGTKSWVTSGASCNAIVLFARTGEHKTRGISALLVERDTPGVEVAKSEEKMGLRSSHSNEIRYDEARIPAENLLAAQGEGFKVALGLLDIGRIGIASQSIGIAQACLEEAVAYAKEREAFGKKIGEFQAIQWKLAEMYARITSGRLMWWQAATLKDAGKPCGKESSAAKLLCSQAATFCADQAVQIFGGNGYSREYAVERHFRNARVTEIYEGTTEIQKMVIARGLLRE